MLFLEKLKKVFYKNNIEIINFENEKGYIEYKCLTCNENYHYSCARNLLSKITLCKKCYSPYKKWDKAKIAERLKLLYPSSDLEVLTFKTLRKGGTIKCKKCGEVENVNNFEAVFAARKNNFCLYCEKEKNDKTYQHLLQELKKGYVKLIKWNGTNFKSEFQCLRCNHLFQRIVKQNFSSIVCPNCHKTHNKFDFKKADLLLNKIGNNEYKLLQFKGMNARSLVQHKCGFCFTLRLEDFKLNKINGCPKCYRNISNGEKQVIKFLKESNIPFEYQKRFSDFKKYSYDFAVYLEDKMILIEFQGRQHYEEVQVFDSLEKQRMRDKKKKEYCLINNIPLIEIPYWEITNIPSYLSSKFKDYLEKE